MRYLYLLLTGFIFFQACTENERLLFEEKESVYLSDYSTKGLDSLVYSFLIKKKEVDTLYIKVKLLGSLLKEDKKFQVTVAEGSSAIEGEHYMALPEFFEFKKGKGVVAFPLVVTNKNTQLDSIRVSLRLMLKETEDLGLGYADRLSMRVILTNQLVRPSYWDGFLWLYFGEYSKVKHKYCVDTMGHDFPLTLEEARYGAEYGIRYWANWGRATSEYYAQNKVLDENGNLITPWDSL